MLNVFAKSEKTDLTPRERRVLKTVLAGIVKAYRSGKSIKMKKGKPTAGERLIRSAREALAFAKGKGNGCVVHVPAEIDVKAIREPISLSQAEFAKLFGLSKRTLEHWEHGRRIPSGPARAFLTVIAREPDAVRRALLG